MTPARKAALQWFHDRKSAMHDYENRPSVDIGIELIDEGLISDVDGPYTITDDGRRALIAEENKQ